METPQLHCVNGQTRAISTSISSNVSPFFVIRTVKFYLLVALSFSHFSPVQLLKYLLKFWVGFIKRMEKIQTGQQSVLIIFFLDFQFKMLN